MSNEDINTEHGEDYSEEEDYIDEINYENYLFYIKTLKIPLIKTLCDGLKELITDTNIIITKEYIYVSI